MQKDLIHYSILLFITGCLSKIYDDINDCNLLQKYKEYINEFLKGSHYILLTYISSKYICSLYIILLYNIPLIIYNTKAFEEPYEAIGVILFFLLFIYLLLNKSFKDELAINFIKFNIINIIFILLVYFVEIFYLNNIEFGLKKLYTRLIAAISFLIFIFLNNYFKYIPNEYILSFWYIVGYCITSTIFQFYLIKRENENTNKKLNTNENTKSTKSNKKSKINKKDKKPKDKKPKNKKEIKLI